MQYTCIDLLPQSWDTIVKDSHFKKSILKHLAFILSELAEAVRSFYIDKEYTKFDPHVGETSCQIRAFKTCLLAMQASDSSKDILIRINDFMTVRQRVLAVLQSYEYSFIGNSTSNLLDYLHSTRCLFELSDVEKYLVQCYFLTRFKIYENASNDAFIDYNEIQKQLAVSKRMAKKIARYYQSALASISCEEVISCSANMDAHVSIADFLRSRLFYDDDGRQTLPAYFTTTILLHYILHYNIPVLVVSERRSCDRRDVVLMMYEVDDSGEFSLMDQSVDRYMHAPCFVIRGATSYQEGDFETSQVFIDRFNKVGLENIILWIMAAHPQYSGKKLLQYRDNPFYDLTGIMNESIKTCQSEYANAKEYAAQIGCSLENAALFFVQHIFCDTLSNQLSDRTYNCQSGEAFISADLLASKRPQTEVLMA